MSKLWHNPVSLIGIAVALLSTVFGLPLLLLDAFNRRTHPYLAVIIYLILPLIAMMGTAMALGGMWWERRRRARQPDRPVPSLPRIDLNRPAHQWAVVATLAGVLLLMGLLSYTGYRAYQFTDSVKFCGLVCHQVMKPEYVAHQHSPHARVACVQCHVGQGADWYLRSKLNGLHQIYALSTNRFARPIPTPVKQLRPAQDTCEQCHWPAKFFGAQQKTFNHYLADEQNSPWQIQMLLKVGGGDPKTGATGGIHWHMNINNEIYYIAADERRERIPWVRVIDAEDHATEYMSTEQPFSPEQVARASVRRMDCVDCHNRPAHVYQPPDRAVEQAFEAGRMDRALPYLKRETVRLLSQPYATEAEARAAIARGLPAFYEQFYPDVARDQEAAIQQAALEAQALYARNVFPEMRTDWRAHSNHIGHLNSDGCFRCHDGLHKSADGRVITKDCNACHTILAQGAPEGMTEARLRAQPFQHPVDVGGDVTEMNCSDCHTGTSGL